jgi:short-subunit dehydrogenase
MKLQKILITGGSRGIGKELVNLYLEQGCEVHIVARDFNEEIKTPNLKFHSFDLSQAHKVNDFTKAFIKDNGVPDLLINNAGAGAFFEWSAFPEEEIQRQINLLFTTPTILCRALAPEMAKREKGKIVNITSLAVLYPLPFMPMYNSCKSALSSFTKSMMLEYKCYPVFIDAVLGDVRTEFNEKTLKTTLDGWTENMKSAWLQIEKQLIDSPPAKDVAKRLKKKILTSKSGVVYEGGFLHRCIYSYAGKIIPDSLKIKILQKRYFSKR